MTSRRVIGLILLGLMAWRMIGVATVANGQDDFGYEFFDCRISGDGILGTLIVFPVPNRGEDVVEIERNGLVLVSDGRAGHQLARHGEVYRAYHKGQLVREGIGIGVGCVVAPPPPPPPTTSPPEATTTTLEAVTTTTVVDTTTTTVPSEPPAEPPIPPGFHDAGAGQVLPNEEGG